MSTIPYYRGTIPEISISAPNAARPRNPSSAPASRSHTVPPYEAGPAISSLTEAARRSATPTKALAQSVTETKTPNRSTSLRLKPASAASTPISNTDKAALVLVGSSPTSAHAAHSQYTAYIIDQSERLSVRSLRSASVSSCTPFYVETPDQRPKQSG